MQRTSGRGALGSDRRWSCAFTAPSSCSHDALFQDAYQRTNRTNRTKIVRCFPHCCPDHKARSYCGSSLQLTVSLPPWPEMAPNDVEVYARFRPDYDDDQAICQGHMLAIATFTASLQSAQRPTATWVTSRVAYRSSSAWAFEINPEARWLYPWNSGATMKTRRSRHVLEAVVVLKHQDAVVEVMAVTKSPTFTVTSFRHAVDSASPRDEPSLLFRALSWKLQLQQQQQQQPYARVDCRKRPMDTVSTVPPREPIEKRTRRTPEPEIDDEAFGVSLGALFESAVHVPASRLAELTHGWDAGLLPVAFSPQTVDTMDAVTMTACLTWWLHTDDHVRRERHGCGAHAVADLGDPPALRGAYHRWLRQLQRRSEQFLTIYGWSWGALVMHIGVSVHARHAFDFYSFVAAVRQQAILPTHRQSYALVDAARPEDTWQCDLPAVRTRRLTGDESTSVHPLDVCSVGLMAALWSQLSCLRVDIDAFRACLRVRSTAAASDAGLELILDGTHRCFANLPNGEPSLGAALLSGFSLGDYIGSIASTGEGTTLHATLFAWPQDSSPHAYRFHWSLRCLDRTPSDNVALRLAVRVEIGGMRRGDDTTRDVPSLETLRLRDKLSLVGRWMPHYDALLPYSRARPAA